MSGKDPKEDLARVESARSAHEKAVAEEIAAKATALSVAKPSVQSAVPKVSVPVSPAQQPGIAPAQLPQGEDEQWRKPPSPSLAGKKSVPFAAAIRTRPSEEPTAVLPVTPQEKATVATAQSPARSFVSEDRFESARREMLGAPEDDFRSLDPAVPLVLLPVRIETRFVGGELQIRVFPDEILADGHERGLTDDEWVAGQSYWRSGWRLGSEPEAWRVLVSRFPAPRAAWIVRLATPTNVRDRERVAEPAFPPRPPSRAASWTRALESRLLPDRWHVRAFRGEVEVGNWVGAFIREPLALTLSPDPTAERLTLAHGGTIQRDLLWTVDFSRACEVGMGIRVSAPSLSEGFDRIIVFGVKATMSAATSAERLSDLFDAHHYSSGFAFLRQGTATNNTEGTTAGYPPNDAGGAWSYDVERTRHQEGDGARFASVLGLRADCVAQVDGTSQREQQAARAMNEALFPATLGYFLEQMMDPVFDASDVAEARGFFVDHVRGRGHLPAFRVGRVPYGVLPVSSLSRWESRPGAGGAERVLPAFLRSLLPIWQEATTRVPRLGATADPDRDLMATLGLNASTRAVRIRPALGPQTAWNIIRLLGLDAAAWNHARPSTTALMARLDHPRWRPRIAEFMFADRAELVTTDFVESAPLSEANPLRWNYIQWLLTATINDLENNPHRSGIGRSATLLFTLLRDSLMSEYLRAALEIEAIEATNDPLKARTVLEPELIGIPIDGQSSQSRFSLFDRPAPDGRSFRDYLKLSGAPATLRSLERSLALLANLPSAELERVFTCTLDTTSHRLDAWITALYSQRIERMRVDRSTGCHIGAYGWAFNVRPDSGGESGGYIQAPSMTHANAAAVLRSAYLSHRGESRERFRIDLSSARVRRGLAILDGVRSGQPLGALLGYQFERGLHDAELDLMVDPLRQRYPLVANKLTPSTEPAETVAARNVVDGLKLRTAGIPPEIRALAGARMPALDAVVEELQASVDSVADLMTAEAVYRAVSGNPSAASAAMDVLGRGIRPGEIQVVQTPATGIGVTFRIALVIDEDPRPRPGWSSLRETPRARVAPSLERWLEDIFGDPRKIVCRVTYKLKELDGSFTVHIDEITLRDLNVRALDAASILRTSIDASGSETDARVLAVLATAQPTAVSASVNYDRDPAWSSDVLTFHEAAEVARTAGTFLGQASPLRRSDLRAPGAARVDDRASGSDSTLAEELRVSLAVVGNALRAAIAAHSVPQLVNWLQEASLFAVPAAFPARLPSLASEARLVEIAETVIAEVARRALAAQAAMHPSGTETADPVEAVHRIFGEPIPVLPVLDVAEVSDSSHLPNVVFNAIAVREWVSSVERVRPRVGSYRRLESLLQALGRGRPTMRVGQVSSAPRATWAAMPGTSPAPGTFSMLLISSSSIAGPTVQGLLIDEWTDSMPASTLATGIAVNLPGSGASAPHTVLLACAPTADPWSSASLVTAIAETQALASVRGVDLEMLAGLSPLVPMSIQPSRSAESGSTADAALRTVLEYNP